MSASAETVDLNDLDVAGGDVDHRHESGNERDLESGSVPLHDQPVLGRAMGHVDHFSPAGANLEPDQVAWPILALVQLASSSDEDLGAPDRLGSGSVGDAVEGQLRALLALTERPHTMRCVSDVDGGAGLEVNEIGMVRVEPDVTIEPVGLSQPPDTDPGRLSRGTRPQL
jgi:hypothetical protein